MKTLSVLMFSLVASGAAHAATCADMAKIKIPGFDNTTITKAAIVPAANGLPQNCQVDGVINQRKGADGKTYGIEFAVALPDTWNSRFLFQGGGGYNGLVRPPVGVAGVGDMPGLARGFAVVSTDTGHKSSEVFDRSYDVDQQASVDFAAHAVGQVAQIAKQVIAQYYGKPANYSYFAGCSTGGREGMVMSQRFPSYFDGIVVGDPAMRTGLSRLGNNWKNVMFNQQAPKDSAGKPEPHKLFTKEDQKVLVQGMMNACDANDGLKDGMIFNPEACKFDPATLICASGKTDACLTQAQVTAVQKAFPGPRNSKGKLVYQMSLYDADVAALLPSLNAPAATARAPQTTIDIDAELFTLLDDPLQAVTDATWTNLSTFSGRGGKLLFYHGMADPTFAAMDTLDYYKKMADANGGLDKTRDFSRYYFVPGMLHCRGGDAALDQFDLLSAVMDWVEKGKAPEAVVATGAALPNRSRPLCPYPEHTHYTGKGNAEDAKSFVCQK